MCPSDNFEAQSPILQVNCSQTIGSLDKDSLLMARIRETSPFSSCLTRLASKQLLLIRATSKNFAFHGLSKKFQPVWIGSWHGQ